VPKESSCSASTTIYGDSGAPSLTGVIQPVEDRRRYVDDIVAGFEHEADARRFLDAMHARGEAFALSLHPDKTRIIEFGPHSAADRKVHGLGKPETFNFLGLIHICAKSRQGKFLIKRKSRSDRVRAKLQDIKDKLRRGMHRPIPQTGKWLGQVVRGFLNYHAVPTNSAAIGAFRHQVIKMWFRTIRWQLSTAVHTSLDCAGRAGGAPSAFSAGVSTPAWRTTQA